MPDNEKSIVVTGDVTVDWLMYPFQAQDKGENWRLHAAAHSQTFPGGALLLADFIRAALRTKGAVAKGFKVVSPHLPKPLRNISPDRLIHSNAMLDYFTMKKGDRELKCLRVQNSLGYIGPKDGTSRRLALNLVPDLDSADIVVLDDAGNGFREQRDSWPKALSAARNTIIVYKMSRPLAEGSLWEDLTKGVHADRLSKNLVVIVNAADLRKIDGAHISKSLSWERTAKDFVFQLQRLEVLRPLQECRNLVVVFGMDGAILYRGGEGARTTLIFDPYSVEDGFAAQIQGSMVGLQSIFTAAMVSDLAIRGLPGLENGIRLGLMCARGLLEAGYVGSICVLGCYASNRPSKDPRTALPRLLTL